MLGTWSRDEEEAGVDARPNQEPSNELEAHTDGSGKTAECLEEHMDSLGTGTFP
jgi:hypothetical protein